MGGEWKNSVARERGGMTKVEKGRISNITHIVFFSYPLSDNLIRLIIGMRPKAVNTQYSMQGKQNSSQRL